MILSNHFLLIMEKYLSSLSNNKIPSFSKIKVNILVGARFNGKLVADFFQRKSIDFYIYSSAPANKWHNPELPKKKIIFIPLVMKILSRILGVRFSRGVREFDAKLFDFIASLLMRKSDVLHGWATFSLTSAIKHKKRGGYFVLERACPHVLYQEKLLIKESDKLGANYQKTSKKFIDRCTQEYTLADKIIVPSLYTLNSFLEYGVDRSKLELLRLDANFSRSGQIYKSKNSKNFVVGSIGGNALRKGFVYLIEAWQSLQIENGTLLLKVTEAELKSIPIIWNKVKIDPTIEIIPYLKKIEDFYMECDVFCLPSIDDGFGMVVLEALACGKPVIATKNVGASELLIDNETGYVVNNRDSMAIAKTIDRLYRDKNLLNKMSDNALKYYTGYQLSKDNFENSISRLYENITTNINK